MKIKIAGVSIWVWGIGLIIIAGISWVVWSEVYGLEHDAKSCVRSAKEFLITDIKIKADQQIIDSDVFWKKMAEDKKPHSVMIKPEMAIQLEETAEEKKRELVPLMAQIKKVEPAYNSKLDSLKISESTKGCSGKYSSLIEKFVAKCSRLAQKKETDVLEKEISRTEDEILRGY